MDKVWPIKGIKTDYEQQNNKNIIFIKFNMINKKTLVQLTKLIFQNEYIVGTTNTEIKRKEREFQFLVFQNIDRYRLIQIKRKESLDTIQIYTFIFSIHS